ncbi:prepilin peptidase [Actinomyces lilanjuaniae]|uniref:prepilin peptidase n=1 Tax=Actinomyces lilanjuaniae TaxID=2321394 RepID=UPI001FAA8FE0|nr:prepilin peptidase [Actinomyces lilanjuaniae]
MPSPSSLSPSPVLFPAPLFSGAFSGTFSSLSALAPWLLGAVLVCSVVVVAGPVSAWARRYVREPVPDEDTGDGSDGNDDSDGSDGGDDAGDSDSGNAVATSGQRLVWPGLLGTGPQAVLALLSCGLCAGWGLRAGATGAALVAVPVYALLTCAASVDVVARLLPNRLLGSAAAWLGLSAVVAVMVGPGSPGAALRAVLCGLGAGGASLLLALLPSGLGMGDVKLCAVIGLWLGWYGGLVVLVALWVGVLLGGLAAVLLLVSRRAGRKDPMAYGPYLVAGALLTWPLVVT